MVPIDQIFPSPNNPRKIDAMKFAALKSSIRKFGLVENLVVNKRTMTVVGGNQRLKACLEEGVTEVPVIFVDLDDLQETLLNITLNNRGLQGEYTEDVLKMIDEIKSGDLEGYDALRLFDVEKELAALEKEIVDDVPDQTPATMHPGVAGLDLELYEHYDYIVIAATNIQDWNYIVDLFEIQKVRSDRRKAIGLGRAIRADKAIELLKKKGIQA